MPSKWVAFHSGKDVFGVSIDYVREMVANLNTRSVPRQPPEQLGVAILRNEILAVLDFRKLVGDVSLNQSDMLIQLLGDRKQDHLNWLAELESCVRENRQFKLALDPTQCKFGKWYSGFKTDDPKLRVLLHQASTPHEKIHELGRRAIALVEDEKTDEALRLISEHRDTTLAKLLNILNQAIQQIHDTSRQVIIVLERNGRSVGLCVDSLHSVVLIDEDHFQPPDESVGFESFEALLGFWTQQQGSIMRLLDVEKLVPALSKAYATA
ncbi:MAG: chemotaxis protein CheW [Calditrichaeota bacterium]|nr:chemotaxis protein CheW [Calditrichota bacterium]